LNRHSDKLVRSAFTESAGIRALRSQRGLHASEDDLIAMRIHGATPEWMAQLQKRRLRPIELQKLIAFRIHGVFAGVHRQIESLGYKHPEPDHLSMRIHA